MTNPEPEPSVPGSNPPPKAGWWRHPIAGIASALIAWVGLTWMMLSSTKGDIAAAEDRLKEGITAVETRLKGEISAVETRLKTDIDAAETRIDDHLARVEGRLDRIMEILLDEARRGEQQEVDGS
ncbi:MAG: hypothetical protein F4139_14205 [Gemmatimonadetes bacterium]|nr:hypothetical protein [Gemmatimonadota bacterium]MYH54072.1 hypothetical protein [Gemmatimonadota bacterium]MYK65377.1 hypothetical protein [Gemmatimonadota bacterium]